MRWIDSHGDFWRRAIREIIIGIIRYQSIQLFWTKTFSLILIIKHSQDNNSHNGMRWNSSWPASTCDDPFPTGVAEISFSMVAYYMSVWHFNPMHECASRYSYNRVTCTGIYSRERRDTAQSEWCNQKNKLKYSSATRGGDLKHDDIQHHTVRHWITKRHVISEHNVGLDLPIIVPKGYCY